MTLDEKNLFHIAVCFGRILCPKGAITPARDGWTVWLVPGRVHFNPCSDLLDAKLDQRNWSAFHRREHGKSSSVQNTMLSSQFSFFIRFAFFFIETNLAGFYLAIYSNVNLSRNRHVITSQTCQDEVKRWVTADFVNVSRCVSVNCNSTFCSDGYLDYSVDSALLNNSEELNIRNFQLRTCVRRPQSLKRLY